MDRKGKLMKDIIHWLSCDDIKIEYRANRISIEEAMHSVRARNATIAITVITTLIIVTLIGAAL